MMFKLVTVLLLASSFSLFGQSNTDVFLLDIENSENGLEVNNMINVSKNSGYDNQPSFANDFLLYAGNEAGQTEIKSFNLNTKVLNRVNKPTTGGEYSPQRTPDNKGYTAVRLDTSGLQRLYHYDDQGNAKLLVDNLRVAYYAFYDNTTILTTVLAENQLDLVLVDLKSMKLDTLLRNSGRSIHKIPGNSGMSYTSVNEEGNLEIFQLDLESMQSFFITQLPIGVQDYAWMGDSKMILGSNEALFLYDLFGNGQWEQIADLSTFSIKNITRLAVSPNGKKLAIVAEPIE